MCARAVNVCTCTCAHVFPGVCACVHAFLGVSVGALGFPVCPSFAIGWHRTREVTLTRKCLVMVRGLGTSASCLRPIAPRF